MTNKTITLKILRFNPEHDKKPYYKSFDIPYDKNWSILDALGYIKDELDTSLSYRWSCRMAVCGSCGFMINGTPKLGCETFIEILNRGRLLLNHWPTLQLNEISSSM